MASVGIQLQQIVAALEKYELQECFDAYYPESRSSEQQQELFDGLGHIRFRYVVSANQCLAEGTKVLTTDGLKNIEDIKAGDQVFDEFGNPIDVVQTFQNGIKPTYSLKNEDKEWVRCTKDHRFYGKNEHGTPFEIEAKEFKENSFSVFVGNCEDNKGVVLNIDLDSELYVPTYDLRVNSPTNYYQLGNGLITHNCGKTQMGVNELRWLLTDTHPTFQRPAHWGKEPLLLLAMSRTTTIIEENIWKKLQPFLPADEIKVQRQGGILKSVTHLPTGNKVVFLSHNSVREAREKAQGLVCHWAWIDEMPNSLEFINEIQMRVREKKGFFLATFTPLIKNDKIRKYVDSLEEPLGKKYQLDFLANPNNKGREEEILKEYENQPYSIMRTRLYGDWSTGEGTVFHYDPDSHIRELPDTYSPNWPHVESVDPASTTIMGYLLAAQDPATGYWYIIKTDYIEGVYVPTDIVETVRKKSDGYNITRRISDHEPWYTKQAATVGMYYSKPDKRDRKMDLISGLQEALGSSVFITPSCDNLIDELINCCWNENQTSIVKASTYHLLDAAQYFADLKPDLPKQVHKYNSFHERIKAESDLYYKREAAAQAKVKKDKERTKRRRRVVTTGRGRVWM